MYRKLSNFMNLFIEVIAFLSRHFVLLSSLITSYSMFVLLSSLITSSSLFVLLSSLITSYSLCSCKRVTCLV